MTRIEFFLEGQLADIASVKDLGLRFSTVLTDAASLDKRGGTFSYTLKLPVTSRNERIFKYAAQLSTVGKFSRPALACQIYIDGHLDAVGLFRLRSVGPDGYQGEVYSDDISWSVAMEDLSLRDLKGIPDHPFSGVFGLNTFEWYLLGNKPDSFIQFPLISYGNFFNGTAPDEYAAAEIEEISFDDYPPSFYYLKLLEQCFAEQGLQVQGSILQDPALRTAAMPYVGEGVVWPWQFLGQAQATIEGNNYEKAEPLPGGGTQFSQVFEYDYTETIDRAHVVRFQLDPYASEYEPFPGNENRWAPCFVYRAKSKERYVAQLSATFVSYATGNPGVSVSLVAYDADGSTVLGEFPVSGGVGPNSSITLTTSIDYDLEVGQVIAGYVNMLNRDPSGIGALYGNTVTASFSVTLPDASLEIEIARNLPDMTQKAFVKSFISLFNLQFKVDLDTRTVTFFRPAEKVTASYQAIDLNKAGNARAGTFEPVPIFKSVKFAWAPDGEDGLLKKNPDFANYLLTSASPVATGTAEVTLPFAATRYRTFRIGVPPFSHVVDLPSLADEEALTTPLNQVQTRFNYTPRLLLFTGISPVGQTITINGVESRYGRSTFPTWLYWQDLYTQYYQRPENRWGHRFIVKLFLERLERQRLLDGYQVELGGDRYQVESIDNYDPTGSEPTTLKLLKNV